MGHMIVKEKQAIPEVNETMFKSYIYLTHNTMTKNKYIYRIINKFIRCWWLFIYCSLIQNSCLYFMYKYTIFTKRKVNWTRCNFVMDFQYIYLLCIDVFIWWSCQSNWYIFWFQFFCIYYCVKKFQNTTRIYGMQWTI